MLQKNLGQSGVLQPSGKSGKVNLGKISPLSGDVGQRSRNSVTLNISVAVCTLCALRVSAQCQVVWEQTSVQPGWLEEDKSVCPVLQCWPVEWRIAGNGGAGESCPLISKICQLSCRLAAHVHALVWHCLHSAHVSWHTPRTWTLAGRVT